MAILQFMPIVSLALFLACFSLLIASTLCCKPVTFEKHFFACHPHKQIALHSFRFVANKSAARKSSRNPIGDFFRWLMLYALKCETANLLIDVSSSISHMFSCEKHLRRFSLAGHSVVIKAIVNVWPSSTLEWKLIICWKVAQSILDVLRCSRCEDFFSDFAVGALPRNLSNLSLSFPFQLNDVDLSNQQIQIPHNTTRLKGATDLSQLTVGSSDKDIRKVGQGNKASSHKKSILFSSWSSWSDCDKRCRQKRSRNCVSRRKCGSMKQIEEKSCPDYM